MERFIKIFGKVFITLTVIFGSVALPTMYILEKKATDYYSFFGVMIIVSFIVGFVYWASEITDVDDDCQEY